MSTGYFLAPLCIVSNDSNSFAGTAQYHMVNEPVVYTHDIPTLNSQLTVTNNGGLFLELSEEFIALLQTEDHASKSTNKIARKQEIILGPMYRICEYLSVLDTCLLAERSLRVWRLIEPSRLYLRNEDVRGACMPVNTDSGSGEHNLRMQPQGSLILAPFNVSITSVSAGADSFNDLINDAKRDSSIDRVSLIAQFHRGCCNYQAFDWGGAILELFSIAEVLANECWRRHVAASTNKTLEGPLGSNTVILAKKWLKHNSGHGKWLPKVSHLLEAALETGQIEKSNYDKLNTAREARNNLIHGQIRPSLEEIEEALDGVAGIVNDVLSIELKTPGGFNYGQLIPSCSLDE